MYSWGVRFTLTVKFDMEVDTTIEKEKITEVSQISSESFRKIQKLLNFRDAARPTEYSDNTGKTIKWNGNSENSSKSSSFFRNS